MESKGMSNNTALNEYRRKVADVINDFVKKHGADEVKHTSEIRKMLEDRLGYVYVMFQEADMCYNKTNKANLGTYASDIILFEASAKRGYFRLLGENYPYTGDVVWVKRSEPNEVVGRWDNGKLSFWGESQSSKKSDSNQKQLWDETTNIREERVIKILGNKKNVKLIENTKEGRLFVRKEYIQYNYDVFKRLQSAKIQGVPQIYSVQQSGDKLISEEEYIEGKTLEELLREKGSLSEKEVAFIAEMLCRILAQMHSMEPPLLHRDIKPSNIILTDDKRVYLIDFNATKELHTNTSEDTMFAWTDGFSAPEQRGAYCPSSRATDIYAVGATLSYLLTGFYANRILAPGRYRAVFAKCIEMDPKNRYQTVEEFEAAFKKA